MYHKSNYTIPKINVNIFYRIYCKQKHFKDSLLKILHGNNYDIFRGIVDKSYFFIKKTTKGPIAIRP